MGKLFGTDGVRGIANKELTAELAFEIGKASAYILAKASKHKPKIIVGKDTRISGDMLEMALVSGFLSAGAEVISIGVLPTPAVAYFVKKFKADAGAVISASHNPFEYNGIKFFNDEGFKLPDKIESEIEDIILNKRELDIDIEGVHIGQVKQYDNATTEYADYLVSTVEGSFKGVKAVIDCANGAAYKVAEDVLKKLEVEVVAINNKPNGININVNCGSQHTEELQERMLKEKADIGLAFDGDADRLIAVDEKGNVLDGDQIIYVCAKMLKAEDRLHNNIVTATVMSNIGFHKAISEIGGVVEVTDVGDRHVVERMREKGCAIGGEQSGHLIFLDHASTGDGVLAALQLMSAVKKSNKKLSELVSEITVYPQVLVNAKVKKENKIIYMENKTIAAEIQKLEADMNGEGRVLIRPSGTEHLVRVMIEGKNEKDIALKAQLLANLIEQELK